MKETILDTNILIEFIGQYFDTNTANRGLGRFISNGHLTSELVKTINSVIVKYSDTNDPSVSGLVIASAFAFIEMTRRFDTKVNSKFTIANLHDFVQNYPGWFLIAPLDMDLIPFMTDVPTHVFIDGDAKPIELTDAIHVATTLSRGNLSYIASTDEKDTGNPLSF